MATPCLVRSVSDLNKIGGGGGAQFLNNTVHFLNWNWNCKTQRAYEKNIYPIVNNSHKGVGNLMENWLRFLIF